MTDSVLKRYTGRKGEDFPDGEHTADTDVPEDLKAFGILRGIRDRAIMLELRKKDGSIMAVGYGYVERVEFDPVDGITISFVGQKIRIKGRNLNSEIRPQARLFEGIIRHKISWIRESDHRQSMMAGDDDIVIDSIE